MIFLRINLPNFSHLARSGIPVIYFSGRKWRYDFYLSTEVPVWHTVSYRPTSSPGYTSALSAMTPCLCPFVSVTSRSYIKRGEQIEPVVGIGLLSTYSTLFKKKFGYPKNNGATLWNFVINSGFATASRWYCQQNSSTVELMDTYCMTVDASRPAARSEL